MLPAELKKYDRRPAGAEADLILDDIYRRSVVFIGLKTTGRDGTPVVEYRATGVAIEVPLNEKRRSPSAIYIVTAGHVVDSCRAKGSLYIAFNTADGVSETEADPDSWLHLFDSDLAAIRAKIPSDWSWDTMQLSPLWFKYIEESADELIPPVKSIGETVFVVGLFGSYSGKGTLEPIARFGNVALIPEDKVPAKTMQGGPEKLLEAYLVELRSMGGHSGSPVYIYHPENLWSERDFHDLAEKISPPPVGARGVREHRYIPYRKPTFLGILQGHYGAREKDLVDGGTIVGSSGISIVIPSKKVVELINQEEFVNERDRLAEEHDRRGKGTAVADVDESGETYARSDFLVDLRKVTRKRDEDSEKSDEE